MYKQIMKPYAVPIKPLPTPLKFKNELKSAVRAILFDIYGTLFVSSSGDIGIARENTLIAAPLKTLLDKYQISIPPVQLRRQLFEAIEADHAVKKNQGIDYPEVRIETIWHQVLRFKDIETARQFAAEYEMIVNPVYPMPHLPDLLKTLEKRKIPMGIISNAQFFTPLLFDLFYDHFPETLGFDPDLIFYSYAYGYAKPSLFLFEQAAQRLSEKGFKPADILYVGNDMLNDIYPAHKTGFQTCLFAGDARSLRLRENDARKNTIPPDAIINDLIQLTDMIP